MFEKGEQVIMKDDVKTSSTHEEMTELNILKGKIVTILDKDIDNETGEGKYEIEETDYYILERYLKKKHNFKSLFNEIGGEECLK